MTTISPQLFNPLAWISDTSSAPPKGALLERRTGFPLASILLDTLPPTGNVILNENLGTGGIKIHRLAALSVSVSGNSNDITSGTMVIQDALDLSIRQAQNLGGRVDPTVYEVIGQGAARSLTYFLLPDESGVYPLVSAIEFGVTSDRSKQYIIEAMRPGDIFRPLISMISNTVTVDFWHFPFTNNVRLAAVRIRYAGDFYTPTANTIATVSGYDLGSGISALQLSHYSDFKDAHDFAATQSDVIAGGWLPYSDGITVYDWETVNNDRIWLQKSGVASGSLKFVVPIGTTGDVICADDTALYSFEKGVLTTRKVFSGGETIRSVISHLSRIFIGTSYGKIYSTSSGKSYDLETVLPIRSGDSSPTPITSLGSYQNRLYIGTEYSSSTDETSGRALIYSWDGFLLRLPFTLGETGTRLSVASLESAQNRLFIGTASDTNKKLGKVYIFDGIGVTAALAPSVDSVQALGYTRIEDTLWAAMSDGSISALSFNGSSLGSWKQVYSGSATTYYQIAGQLSDNFVFIPSSSGLILYLQDEVGDKKFVQVPKPPVYTLGVLSKWYNTSSNWTTIPNISTSPNYTGVDAPINYVPLTNSNKPSGVVLNGNVVVWTGFLKAFETGTHKFYLLLNDGGRLYIDGKKVIDRWYENPDVEYSVNVNLVAGEFVPFRLEYFAAGDSSAKQAVGLYWSTPSQPGKRLVPKDAFATSITPISAPLITSITVSNGQLLGVTEEGGVYSLDTTSFTERTRFIYARFRDVAGNISTSPGTYTDPLNPSKIVYSGIFDNIIQGGEPNAQGSQSSGRIWQVASANRDGFSKGDLITEFATSDTTAFYGPDRWVRQHGIFESDPFYVATLSSWDTLDVLTAISTPSNPNPPLGLDNGAEVLISVRAGATREECFSSAWGTPLLRSTITAPSSTGALHSSLNISTVVGNWIQFKVELVTATKNLTPYVQSATLSYFEARASYFFTKVFNTAEEVTSPPYPLWRRGLLTANVVPNGGKIQFGYTTDTDINTTFEFSRYTPIVPNRVFELPAPNTNIRFGILLVSLQGSFKALVNDFAVQLDAGDANMYLMQ